MTERDHQASKLYERLRYCARHETRVFSGFAVHFCSREQRERNGVISVTENQKANDRWERQK
jgi:hypothetical protein